MKLFISECQQVYSSKLARPSRLRIAAINANLKSFVNRFLRRVSDAFVEAVHVVRPMTVAAVINSPQSLRTR